MSDRVPAHPGWILAVLACLVSIPGPGRAESLNEVRGLVLAGERPRARAVLDSLLSRGTDLDEAARASAAFMRANLEEDGDQLERRLREYLNRDGGHPSDQAAAHLELGRLSLSRGLLTEAVFHFRKAREQGLEEEGSLWLGLAAMAMGDVPTARAALERAASSGSSRIRQRALLARGDLERLRQEWGRALQWYGQVRRDTRQGLGWGATAAWREAECLENLGDLTEARIRLDELLEQYPGAYETPLARARLRIWEDPVLRIEPGGDAVPSTAETPSSPSGASFAVQVGAFSLQENADRLADDLRQRGFVRVRVLHGEGLHRVVVGSFPARPAAETLADSLGAAMKSSVSIVPLGEERR